MFGAFCLPTRCPCALDSTLCFAARTHASCTYHHVPTQYVTTASDRTFCVTSQSTSTTYWILQGTQSRLAVGPAGAARSRACGPRHLAELLCDHGIGPCRFPSISRRTSGADRLRSLPS